MAKKKAKSVKKSSKKIIKKSARRKGKSKATIKTARVTASARAMIPNNIFTFKKNPEVNVLRVVQMIIGAVSLVLGIAILSVYEYLLPVVGLTFLFGIFAIVTAMKT